MLNRGYGVGDYKFEYCLIDMSREYLIENHLICVVHKHSLERPKLMELYKQVMNSFQNEKTKEFILTVQCIKNSQHLIIDQDVKYMT